MNFDEKRSVIIVCISFTIVATACFVFFPIDTRIFDGLAPGPYPFAQTYVLEAPENEVIKVVTEFKLSHSEFIVPDASADNRFDINLKDGRDNSQTNHWYHFYFYYQNDKKILLTCTRPSNNVKTMFAFVSMSDDQMLGGWKRINNDFSDAENIQHIQTFEQKILNPIKAIVLKTKQNGK